MAIQTYEGFVTVYESSDGGTGDPMKTFWQFFVDDFVKLRVNVTTPNHYLADTMRIAMDTASLVRVTYDDVHKNSFLRHELSSTTSVR